MRHKQTAIPDAISNQPVEAIASHGVGNNLPPQTGTNKRHATKISFVDTVQHKFVSARYVLKADSVGDRKVVGANKLRRYLLIQNNGTGTVILGFGTRPPSETGAGIRLTPNASITFENGIVPNNDLYYLAIADTEVDVIEGTMVPK